MLQARTYNFIAFISIIIISIASCSASSKEIKHIEYSGIIFSHESGHYSSEFELKLGPAKNKGVIIYTLDGSEPQKGNSSTFEYTAPILIKKRKIENTDISYIPTTTQPEKPNYETWLPPKRTYLKGIIIRSRLILKDGTKNKTVTKTYFVDSLMPNLPEIYLTVNKNSLFDNDTGIYIPGVHQVKGKKYTGNFFKRGKE